MYMYTAQYGAGIDRCSCRRALSAGGSAGAAA
eukprot:COSAG01_NODE_59467_length_300_cov_0.751244_1_plen_31_part_01